MKFIKNCIHLIVMELLLVLIPLAFFLQMLYGEGLPTSIEVNVFIALALLIVVLSFAKRLLGGFNSMNFVCLYSFLFLVFWIAALVDSVKYERGQILDFIRIIGFATALVSTLLNLKVDQFKIRKHHKKYGS